MLATICSVWFFLNNIVIRYTRKTCFIRKEKDFKASILLIRTILRTLQVMMSLPDHDNYTLPTYQNTIRPLNKNNFLQIFNNTYHKNVIGTI